MKLIIALFGLSMFYAWIHGIVIVFKKIEDLTQYEKVVLWFGFITFVLFVLGVAIE